MELERKVATLESEVMVVKGEVKTLLTDLREMMNNAENPFYRVQALPIQEATLPEESSRKTVDMKETIEEKDDVRSVKNPGSDDNSGNSGQPFSSNDLPDQPGYGANSGPVNPMQSQYGNGPNFPGSDSPGWQRNMPQTSSEFPNPENPEDALWAHNRMQNQLKTQPGWSQNNEENPEIESSVETNYGLGAEDLSSLKQHENLVREVDGAGNEKRSALKGSASGQKTDIFMLIELMRWTDHTLKTVEKEKLKETLDLYELAGYLPEYVKTLILKIVNISYQDAEQEYKTGMKDYIRAISQLNTILNPGKIDPRLLHFVFEGMPWREAENEVVGPYYSEGK